MANIFKQVGVKRAELIDATVNAVQAQEAAQRARQTNMLVAGGLGLAAVLILARRR